MKPRQGLIKQTGEALKKALPTILSILGATGVVTTVVLAVKATPKALERIESAKATKSLEKGEELTRMETMAACWQCYIPATAAGIATIGCILGANVLNRRQQVSLASAYALISRQYGDYKRKVKEMAGEEVHKQIMKSLAVEKAQKVPITAESFIGYSNLDFDDANEEPRLFYDTFSERYFESTISRILQAEYHLNRNFMFGGYISLNEFYKFLGIEETELGAAVGWNGCNGDIFWIDFDHSKTMVDDGLSGEVECYIIDMVFPPDETYLEDV